MVKTRGNFVPQSRRDTLRDLNHKVSLPARGETHQRVGVGSFLGGGCWRANRARSRPEERQEDAQGVLIAGMRKGEGVPLGEVLGMGCLCLCACVSVHACIHLGTYVHPHVCVCVCIFVFAFMFVHTHECVPALGAGRP